MALKPIEIKIRSSSGFIAFSEVAGNVKEVEGGSETYCNRWAAFGGKSGQEMY